MQEKTAEKSISVIIPNYDGGKTIGECLDHVLSQEYNNFEVIVVDDASQDDSAGIIKKYEQTILIQNDKNFGPAHSRNIGASHAKGSILVFIDSDIHLPKNALKLINNAFDERDLTAVVGMLDKYCRYENTSSQHYNLRMHFNYMRLPEYIDITYGSITAIRKNVFNEVGGYDINYRHPTMEDADLGIRIHKIGHKIKQLKGL